jgi:hypothetical protein
MNEKLQTQAIFSQPKQTQSIFGQFKSWLNKSQIEKMNKNLENAATEQTPLKRALAKVYGLITGDNTRTKLLAQDLIDYRYEMARLERKRTREAKGQSFEEYVNEIVAQKQEAKARLGVENVDIKQNKTPKPKNSIINRLKALAALTLVSGSTMMAPEAFSQNQAKIESKTTAKTEVANKTITKKTNPEYTNTKFKFTIPNVESATIKTGTIVNEYRSNGVSFKGRFVVMPNGALFNLEGRSVKITSKNIYAIENDRSGYFNLNDTKATKKVTPGQKIAILNGEIVMVPDSKPNSNTKTKVKQVTSKPSQAELNEKYCDYTIPGSIEKCASSDYPILIKAKYNGRNVSVRPIKMDCDTALKFLKEGKPYGLQDSLIAFEGDLNDGMGFFRNIRTLSKDINGNIVITSENNIPLERLKTTTKAKYLDPSTGNYQNVNISLRANVQKLERMMINDKKSINSALEHGFYLDGKMYSAFYNRESKQIEFYEFDHTKPESILNKDPESQEQNPILLKAKYQNKTVYLRLDKKHGKEVLDSLNSKGSGYIKISEINYGRDYDKSTHLDILYSSKTITKDQNGNLILKD